MMFFFKPLACSENSLLGYPPRQTETVPQQTRNRGVSTRLIVLKLAVFVLGFCCAESIAEELPQPFDNLVIVAMDEAQLPAEQSGVMREIMVKEGQQVQQGDCLARLDDRLASIQQQLALIQFEISAATANDSSQIELLQKSLVRQQRLAKQFQAEAEIAERQASNDLRVQAAAKAAAVARNEWSRATDARAKFVDSVSASEIEALKLAFDRAELETQQATFERELDRLQMIVRQQALAAQQIAVTEADVEVTQAKHQQHIESLQKELMANQREIAEVTLRMHSIMAPFDAMVVQVYRKVGEWVREGDVVLRLVRINRLRAEGYADASVRNRLKNPQYKMVLWRENEQGERVQRVGNRIFVSPEIDPVNNQFRFWVEFDNPDEAILPGMRMTLQVEPK